MPLLTSEQLAEIPDRLESLTRKFEEAIFTDIAKRIKKTGSITDDSEWQLMRLSEIGYAVDFMQSKLAQFTEQTEDEIKRLFFETAQVSDDFYKEVYAKTGKPFVPLEENEYMKQMISACAEQTSNEFKNFTGSTGFRIRKPDGTAGYAKARTAYLNAIDLAHAESVNGLFSPQEAIRNAVRTLTDSGIRFVEYESGRIFHADVAVRRAVMTGISQITGNISKYNAEELGTDIVEVTAHAGARPDHAEWQGKLYSLSGLSDKYPSLVAVTGYGTGEGLKGWNCRHDFHPYIEGVSKRSYTDEELENIDPPPINYDGRIYTYYECTQRQRHMETAMRRTKRELIGAKATDDQEYFTEKAIRLRRQKEEYERFSKCAGLLTEYERTHVYELNHSVAGKLSAVYRKNPQ